MKIKLTLTAEHNDQVGNQIKEWASSPSHPSMTYYEYCKANPLTLEFDVPDSDLLSMQVIYNMLARIRGSKEPQTTKYLKELMSQIKRDHLL